MVTEDVTVNFNKLPQGRHFSFTIDFLVNKPVDPRPVVTLDSRIINPPTLPTLTDGLRVVLSFNGVNDDTSTRFVYVGGTVDSGGGGSVNFPIDFPELDGGTVGNVSVAVDFSLSNRHARKYTLNGDISLNFTNPPTNETAYTNIIILQDGTGGHAVTLPVGTVNKTVVENGILTGSDRDWEDL